MPNRTASSPASPCVWSVSRLRAGGSYRLAIRPACFLSWRSGLVSYGNSDDDLTMALAHELVSGDAGNAAVEDILLQVQEIAAPADQPLVRRAEFLTKPDGQPWR